MHVKYEFHVIGRDRRVSVKLANAATARTTITTQQPRTPIVRINQLSLNKITTRKESEIIKRNLNEFEKRGEKINETWEWK